MSEGLQELILNKMYQFALKHKSDTFPNNPSEGQIHMNSKEETFVFFRGKWVDYDWK